MTGDAIDTQRVSESKSETTIVTADHDNIDSYDSVLFTVCDLFGRPRGRFVFGPHNIRRLATRGLETPHSTCVLGFNSESPATLPKYKRADGSTRLMLPDMATLRPLSWFCNEGRKVGHVLCDLCDLEGRPVASSPRVVALRQLDSLRALGFEIMTAFETEYILFHKGTLNPYGGDLKEVMNMVRLDSKLTFLYDHMMELLASGIPAETQMEETVAGQFEYSMQPQFGISMADAAHQLRYVTKSVCGRNGLEPTFMTRPKENDYCSAFHFNHSLWTLDGKNAFYDPNNDHDCSDIFRHWVAGLIHHGNALTALMNPTVNCYERRKCALTPDDNIWNYNDRYARLRVKTKNKNIYIEDRMPSTACNPYLVLAGIVAAGVDGIARKLEAPPPRVYRPKKLEDESAKAVNPLPMTLDEALLALHQDTVLTKALGEDFVQEYVALCKEFQLEKLRGVMDKEAKERFEAERNLYLHTL